MSLEDKIKKSVWIFLAPLVAFFRDLLMKAGLIRHEERQPYLLGRLTPGKTREEFEAYLVSLGFEDKFMRWRDPGEVLSLRKIHAFRYQYHVRLFNDGEVRAHYEFAPEYRPVAHLMEWGMEPRTSEFMEIFENWLE